MMRYLVKRLLLFIPALFVVSLLAFYISVNAPGDPVEMLSQPANAQGANAALTASRQYKDSVRVKLGLHLPLFYFSLGTSSDCDTLYRVFDQQERYALHRLSRQYGHWPLVQAWYRSVKSWPGQLARWTADSLYKPYLHGNATGTASFSNDTIQAEISWLSNTATLLPVLYQTDAIARKLDSAAKLLSARPYFATLTGQLNRIQKDFSAMTAQSGTAGNLVPQFTWHGSSNQYHRWLMELLRGNFGYSYVDQRPIAEKIWPRFLRSFTLVLLSVLLAYAISIPLGVYSARHKGRLPDRLISILVFLLYSIPLFFAGTVLLYFFANPEYLAWFPESGYCDPAHYDAGWSLAEKVYHTFPYMVLPLVTYTYASFAFISRIVRSAVVVELEQDYIRTARAKGLSQRSIVWRHALRNAWLPVITTFVNVFPAAVAGSVLVETIFGYDGMGTAAYESVSGRDYPTIVCIFSLAGLMSMVAYLVADILYALVDPRIRYTRQI